MNSSEVGIPTHEVLHLTPTEGAPFTFDGIVYIQPDKLEKVVRSLDITPFARWNLGRRECNPVLLTKGSGYEGHVVYKVHPAKIVHFVAEQGIETRDSIARFHKYDWKFLRQIDQYVHDDSHPILSREVWEELDIDHKMNLARFRAERSIHRTQTREYQQHIAFVANTCPYLKARVAKNGNHVAWSYEKNHDIEIPRPRLPIGEPKDDQALLYLETRQEQEGFEFMRQLGRIGDMVFLTLYRNGLIDF